MNAWLSWRPNERIAQVMRGALRQGTRVSHHLFSVVGGFAVLFALTLEGAFGDPKYGGNAGGRGFAMIRKSGKLPGNTVRFTYDLEYGTDTIEIQEDAIMPGQRVVVLDDLLATGGTMQAAINLVRQRGGVVTAAACIIELLFLHGRARIDVPFTSMVAYDT